jgi:UPF0755 protein
MRKILLIALALVAGGLLFAWKPVKAIYFSGVPGQLEQPFIHIPTGTDFEGLTALLRKGGYITDESSFQWVANRMKYGEKIRPGRYAIEPGWNNRELIRHLRSGKQAEVKVVLNNERLPEEVAGKAAKVLEADSLGLLAAFRDPALLQELGYTPETLMAAFIPNTYNFQWNTNGPDFVRRMVDEHQKFWAKNDRNAKAKSLGMTPTQVYTLASIVERETNTAREKPTIAGVYLNRLRIDMPLQADPTAVFATRDFGTRRVTQYHTGFDSPYNTYRYRGLPPGPISMASAASIDAVLEHEKHQYLYFCAKADESGSHAFAETLAQHNVNAQRFYAWMREKGIQ